MAAPVVAGDMIVGATAARVVGGQLHVSALSLSAVMLSAAFVRLTAGVIKLNPGDITITLDAGQSMDNLLDMLGHAENLPLDAIIVNGLTNAQRSAFVRLCTRSTAQDATAATANRETGLAQCAMMVAVYYMHGSLAGVLDARGLTSTYALKALGLEKSAYESKRLTSVVSARDAHFPGLLDGFFDLAVHFSPTLVSRFKLGLGGNRHLAVLARVRAKLLTVGGLPQVLKYMCSEEVINNMPYISFHPHHPMKPTRDVSKGLFAAIGHYGRLARVEWAREFDIAKGLYIEPVRVHLAGEYTEGTTKLPSLHEMIQATDVMYSAQRLG